MWEALGTLTPSQQWQTFPLHSDGASVIKVAYHVPGGDFSKTQSFAWFRRAWRGTVPRQVDKSLRLYPKPEHQIIEIPIPLALQQIGQIEAEYQIKRGFSRYHDISEPVWSVTLEALTL